MKIQKKTMFFAILTLLWTAVIFSFSLQPAGVSAGMSGGILQRVLDWFYAITGVMLPADLMHTVIRKTAHFCEFFLLGTLSYQVAKGLWKIRWPALCYGALVAVTDEVIQYFTGSGRAMRFADMCLDTLGVAAAILVAGFLGKICAKRKHKNTKKEEKIA